jgi:putative flippase GtrA
LLQLNSDGYEFEFSALIAANRLGQTILQVPITTQYEHGNPTSHFRPIKDSLKIYYQFVKFSVSSIIGFAVDISIFALLFIISSNVWVSTVFARVISGMVNFFLNDQVVFSGNKEQSWQIHAVKYSIVWLLLIVLSASMVSLISASNTTYVIAAKILIDLILFLVSFYLQKKYVFI